MSKDCFFIIHDNKLIGWNYQNHKQYELSAAHARRFAFLVYNPDAIQQDNPVDQDLLQTGLLSTDPTPDCLWGWDVLSRIFHFGTKNIPLDTQPENNNDWAKFYLEHCEDVWLKELPSENKPLNNLETFPLPRQISSTYIESLLEKRSTSRAFFDTPLRLETLAHLLQISLGFIKERELPESSNLPEALRKRRSSPSGGGLNSTEAYIYAKNVSGLETGLYYYDPSKHCLRLTSRKLPTLGKLLSGQHFANNIPAGVFLTSRLDKLWWKYEHSRAYRIALLETGHVAQTIQIMATALNLSTWPTGALTEKAIDPLIGLDNPCEQVLFFVGCGHATGNANPNSLQAIIE